MIFCRAGYPFLRYVICQGFSKVPPPKTKMTMENPPFEYLNMYFLLKKGIFQCHVSFR